LILPNVHESVFPALGQSVVLDMKQMGALGVVETFSGTSIFGRRRRRRQSRTDHAVPHSHSNGLGRQGIMPDGPALWPTSRAGVQAAADEARRRGLLVSGNRQSPGRAKKLF